MSYSLIAFVFLFGSTHPEEYVLDTQLSEHDCNEIIIPPEELSKIIKADWEEIFLVCVEEPSP